MSNTLAIEGKKHGIVVSTIAPNAGTAMTATIMPPEMVQALKPEYVAPFVCFMSHESFKDNGGVYECGSGWIASVRLQRTLGATFNVKESFTPKTIESKWNQIQDWTRTMIPVSLKESVEIAIKSTAKAIKEAEKSQESVKSVLQNPQVKKIKETLFKPVDFDFSEKDIILYALGVGANQKDLALVYENDAHFTPLPTFGVIPAFKAMDNVPLTDILPSFNPVLFYSY